MEEINNLHIDSSSSLFCTLSKDVIFVIISKLHPLSVLKLFLSDPDLLRIYRDNQFFQRLLSIHYPHFTNRYFEDNPYRHRDHYCYMTKIMRLSMLEEIRRKPKAFNKAITEISRENMKHNQKEVASLRRSFGIRSTIMNYIQGEPIDIFELLYKGDPIVTWLSVRNSISPLFNEYQTLQEELELAADNLLEEMKILHHIVDEGVIDSIVTEQNKTEQNRKEENENERDKNGIGRKGCIKCNPDGKSYHYYTTVECDCYGLGRIGEIICSINERAGNVVMNRDGTDMSYIIDNYEWNDIQESYPNLPYETIEEYLVSFKTLEVRLGRYMTAFTVDDVRAEIADHQLEIINSVNNIYAKHSEYISFDS